MITFLFYEPSPPGVEPGLEKSVVRTRSTLFVTTVHSKIYGKPLIDCSHILYVKYDHYIRLALTGLQGKIKIKYLENLRRYSFARPVLATRARFRAREDNNYGITIGA